MCKLYKYSAYLLSPKSQQQHMGNTPVSPPDSRPIINKNKNKNKNNNNNKNKKNTQ